MSLEEDHDFGVDGLLTGTELSANGVEEEEFEVGLVDIVHFDEDFVVVDLVEELVGVFVVVTPFLVEQND